MASTAKPRHEYAIDLGTAAGRAALALYAKKLKDEDVERHLVVTEYIDDIAHEEYKAARRAEYAAAKDVEKAQAAVATADSEEDTLGELDADE